MRWSNKVDVVASLALQRPHHLGQDFRGDLSSLIKLADIVVLAKDAREIAPGEEYGAAAAAAYKRSLFTEVGRVAGYFGQSADATKATLVLQAVSATVPGADLTRLQAGLGPAGAILKGLKGHPIVAGQGDRDDQCMDR
jgi:hypothetical protein